MFINAFKSLRYALVLSLLILGLAINIGSVESDDEEECDETKWEKMTENTYRLYLWLDDSLQTLSDGTVISSAQSISITGTISKQYCSGKTSGEFSFTGSFSAGSITVEESLGFSELYTYKIENDEDVLYVNYSITIVSELGNTYELEMSGYKNFKGSYLKETVHTSMYVPAIVGHYELRLSLYASQIKLKD